MVICRFNLGLSRPRDKVEQDWSIQYIVRAMPSVSLALYTYVNRGGAGASSLKSECVIRSLILFRNSKPERISEKGPYRCSLFFSFLCKYSRFLRVFTSLRNWIRLSHRGVRFRSDSRPRFLFLLFEFERVIRLALVFLALFWLSLTTVFENLCCCSSDQEMRSCCNRLSWILMHTILHEFDEFQNNMFMFCLISISRYRRFWDRSIKEMNPINSLWPTKQV